MDGLETKYQGEIEFTRIDVMTESGDCEFQKHGFQSVPAMIYINGEGEEMAATQQYQDQSMLDQRLSDLLGGSDAATTGD